jgi:UDP-N-acetyl-D-mannosaminuronate dehydrogenase
MGTILNRTSRIVVLGSSYVGLPTSVRFANAVFTFAVSVDTTTQVVKNCTLQPSFVNTPKTPCKAVPCAAQLIKKYFTDVYIYI